MTTATAPQKTTTTTDAEPVMARIADIRVDDAIRVRHKLKDSTVNRYMAAFDEIMAKHPIGLTKTDTELLLHAGEHRLRAAINLGRKQVRAIVTPGTRQDAMRRAVLDNTENAEPLTAEERDDAIRRLDQLNPEMLSEEIAKAMSVSPATVTNVLKVKSVKERFTRKSPLPKSIKETHLREIGRADAELWEPLIEAVAKDDWTTEETAHAVRIIKNEDRGIHLQRALVKTLPERIAQERKDAEKKRKAEAEKQQARDKRKRSNKKKGSTTNTAANGEHAEEPEETPQDNVSRFGQGRPVARPADTPAPEDGQETEPVYDVHFTATAKGTVIVVNAASAEEATAMAREALAQAVLVQEDSLTGECRIDVRSIDPASIVIGEVVQGD